MKKLRIAFFVTSEMPFPIPADYTRPYAPLMIALDIAQGLGKKGHEIIFFGPRGSKGNRYITAYESNITPLYKNKILIKTPLLDEGKARIHLISDTYIIQDIFAEHQKKPFDIIHIYSPAPALSIAKNFPQTKIVYTLQNTIFPWEKALYRAFENKNHYFVSCSKNQREQAPNLNYIQTIHNAVDTKLFSYSESHDNYLLFVGRTHKKKGLSEAIQVARTLNKKLLIIGSPITEPDWWHREIHPYLGKDIEYLGYKQHGELPSYFQKAEAFLMPILWEEPFGRVVIEAMSCGTPVVAFNRGAMPEIIKHGKTGFIVNTTQEMIEAVKNINSISRKNCRDHIEKNFSLENKISEYEILFKEITKK